MPIFKKNKSNHSKSIQLGQTCSVPPYQQITELIKSLITEHRSSAIAEISNTGNSLKHSYIDLYEKSKQLATYLDKKGAKQHDHIVILYDTAHEYITAMWACFIGGYVAVPWSYFGVEKDQSLFLSSLNQLLDSLHRPYLLTSQTGEIRLNIASLERTDFILLDTTCIPKYQKTVNSINSLPGSTALLIATSGTTGLPKLANISYQTMFNRNFVRLNLAASNANRILNLSPLNTISTLGLLFPDKSSYYYNGYYLSISPLQFIKFLAQEKISHFGITSHLAHMLSRLILAQEVKVDLSYLKSISFGADYIVPERVTQFLMALQYSGLKELQLTFAYGMTELGLVATSKLKKSLLSNELSIQNTSLANVCKSVDIRVVNKNDHVVPMGEMGEIQIRSPYKIFSGYYNVDNSNIFTSDGWYRTRDLGIIKNGTLDVTGRTTSLIKHVAEITTFELFEEKLHGIDGIQNNLIFVSEVAEKKQLLVFFVPQKRNADNLNRVRDEIKARASGYLGELRFLPIKPEQIITTRTSKIHRDALKQLYLDARMNLNEELPTKVQVERNTRQLFVYSDEIYKTVQYRWMVELKQITAPEPSQNLFEAGGDSLDFVIVLSEVEKLFSIELDAETFYKQPLLGYLCEMVAMQLEGQAERPLQDRDQAQQLWSTLAAFMLSWPGESHEENLIHGLNVEGNKTPIFWVFQEAVEFQSLASSLGPEQPLYAMRSLTKTEYSNYPDKIINLLTDRYVTEIMKVKGASSLILGGNCQGGLIALPIARKLLAMNQNLSKLVLLEWSKSTEIYEGNILLLYGQESPTASVYVGQNQKNINWENAFPNRTVSSLPCGHGQFFNNNNVSYLAAQLCKS